MARAVLPGFSGLGAPADVGGPLVFAGIVFAAVVAGSLLRRRGRRRRPRGLGDAGFYHEQPDYWEQSVCWRRAYDKARAAHAPKTGARRHADATCAR